MALLLLTISYILGTAFSFARNICATQSTTDSADTQSILHLISALKHQSCVLTKPKEVENTKAGGFFTLMYTDLSYHLGGPQVAARQCLGL